MYTWPIHSNFCCTKFTDLNSTWKCLFLLPFRIQWWFVIIIICHILGGTLADYIQKRCNSLLDEDTILHFFVQILLALYHVHNKLILHRDLKTQNILLDKHQMIVKIGDFGISKILVSKSKAYTVSAMWYSPVSLVSQFHFHWAYLCYN